MAPSSSSATTQVLPSSSSLWAEEASPVVLALDTSSTVGGVAVTRGAEVLGEETWHAGGRQTVQVMPAAIRLCERAGLSLADVSLVAVATGPGSFTGLRVGVSLAKGVAAARGVPLVGISTLDVVASQFRDTGRDLVTLVDAGRGQIYAAAYRNTRGDLTRRGEIAVLSEDELPAFVRDAGRSVFVGGELTPVRALVLGALPGVRVASPATTLRRPAHLAEAAFLRWLSGSTDQVATLQPLYLKRG
jgi:tRNA threonylcarbamoyladenosine biosynthesis protein TsaB